MLYFLKKEKKNDVNVDTEEFFDTEAYVFEKMKLMTHQKIHYMS